MSNPSYLNFKEKTVVKVATAVMSGTIHKHRLKGRRMEYIATYRLTGEAAPSVAEIGTEGLIMFQDNPEEESINSSESIDIYVMCNFENQTDSEFGHLVVSV